MRTLGAGPSIKLTHRTYSGRAEYNLDDRLFVGHVIEISDIVGFHAERVTELDAVFREAVDDYLEMCGKLGRSPEPIVGAD